MPAAPVAAPARAWVEARISPDGTRVALTANDEELDIWVWDLERDALTRVSSDPSIDFSPTWTPDGRQLVFSSNRQGVFNLFRRSADGTGTAERLTASDVNLYGSAIEPGETHALSTAARGQNDLVSVALDGTGAYEVLLDTEFSEMTAVLSPDGRWMAYASDVSGQPEIYVRPYPDVGSAQRLISVSGGRLPVWPGAGRELFYRGPDGGLWAVPIQTDPTLAPGTPERLFSGGYYDDTFGRRSYDVDPDGQPFLMITRGEATDTDDTPRLVWVENWLEELKRLVPPN